MAAPNEDAGPRLLPGGEPWREKVQDFSPERRAQLIQFVESYKPLDVAGVENANILMVGQIGAGKSSFFNTINAIFKGFHASQAPTGHDPESLTKKYRRYNVRKSRGGSNTNFRLCDTMGLEEGSKGMDITDFKYILDGHIQNNYEFKPMHRLAQDTTLRQDIGLGEHIHVVGLVIDALNVDYLEQSVTEKITEVRREATRLAIPILVILTKIDTVCKYVETDITTVFRSIAVRDAAKKAAEIVQIPVAQVVPVKNYERGTELIDGVDILALLAMRQLLRLADSFFDEQTAHLNIREVPANTRPDLLPNDKPWRAGVQDLTCMKREVLKKEIEEYAPLDIVGVKHVNILMTGQIGAGKSSFFNTVNSVFRGSFTAQAAAGIDPNSLTKVFRKYEVRASRGARPLRFRLYDTMGLEQEKGLDITDFRLLLEGNVKDNQVMRPGERLSDTVKPFRTELAEKMHVAAILMDSTVGEYMPEPVVKKLREIRREANRLNIPVLVILTKIDQTCEEVKRDITTVYHSTAVYECIKKAAGNLQILPANVVPIQNYEAGTELEVGVDVLALLAIRQLLRLADNYFDDHLSARGISTLSGSGSDLLHDPWRKDNADFSQVTYDKLLDNVKKYKPLDKRTKQARILLLGCKLSGKSSLINTIASVYATHVVELAPTGADCKAGTAQIQEYPINTSGQPANCVIWDTPGLVEEGPDTTSSYHEVLTMLEDTQKAGRVYGKQDASQQSADRQVHVAAFVIDATTVGKMPAPLKTQLAKLRRAAVKQGLPVVVIVTKIDKICAHVNQNVANVCMSSNVRDCVADVAEMMEVTLAQVLTVRNYAHETDLVKDVDILTLYAMRQLLRVADNLFRRNLPLGQPPSSQEAAVATDRSINVAEDSASLPPGWKVVRNANGEPKYMHTSGTVSMERPRETKKPTTDEDHARTGNLKVGVDSSELAPGWEMVKNAKGDEIYIHESGKTTKEKPQPKKTENIEARSDAMDLAPGWEMAKNAKGDEIYIHESGKATTERPLAKTTEVSFPGANSGDLPPGWQTVTNAKGEVKYIHESGKAVAERPQSTMAQSLTSELDSLDLAPGWEMVKNANGEVSYIHESGNVTKLRPLPKTTETLKAGADSSVLPDGWEMVTNAKGFVMYIHESGTSSKDRPLLPATEPAKAEVTFTDLPPGWEMFMNAKGDVSYVHEAGEVTKVKPVFIVPEPPQSADTAGRPVAADPLALPYGWRELIEPQSGRPYYYNDQTGVTQWERPVQ